MNIASAVILCTIVGAVGAIILVAAAKFMAVEEDPRIEEVASCLAGANCGGCGYAAVPTMQRLSSWTACLATSALPAAPRLLLPLPRSWAVRQALWRRRPWSSARAAPSTASPLTTTRASRPAPLLLPCTAAPRPAPLPASVWATAPRSVSSTPSTSWTVLPRWTRTSVPAAVPAPTSAPSR